MEDQLVIVDSSLDTSHMVCLVPFLVFHILGESKEFRDLMGCRKQITPPIYSTLKCQRLAYTAFALNSFI